MIDILLCLLVYFLTFIISALAQIFLNDLSSVKVNDKIAKIQLFIALTPVFNVALPLFCVVVSFVKAVWRKDLFQNLANFLFKDNQK